MNEGDRRFIRQTLAMALGALMMAPDTETKSEMIERLKRSMEKIDATPTLQTINPMETGGVAIPGAATYGPHN